MARLKATTHAKLAALLDGKSSIKIGHNTWAEDPGDGTINIRLHNTVIVVLRRDGSVKFTTGGWNTVTTRERINQFLPGNHRVHTIKKKLHLDGEPVDPYDSIEESMLGPRTLH